MAVRGRRLLQRTDWFTQEKACKLLSLVLLARPQKEVQLANGAGAGPSTSSAAAARSSPAVPIVSAASEGVQVRG